MPRVRSLDISDMNQRCNNPDIEVIDRLDDSEFCKIRHLACGHTSKFRIAHLNKSVNNVCKICHELEMVNKCTAVRMTYLTKLSYGTSKSRYEYRLASCNICGNFILFTPQHIRSGQISCKLCPRARISERCNVVGYELLNKVNKNDVLIKCKTCSSSDTFQVSNLMRTRPYCNKCNKR